MFYEERSREVHARNDLDDPPAGRGRASAYGSQTHPSGRLNGLSGHLEGGWMPSMQNRNGSSLGSVRHGGSNSQEVFSW